MSRSFNLTAELNLRGPSNLRTVVADIRRQISSIDANVNINVDQTTTRNIGSINQGLVALNRQLRETATSARNTNTAIQNLSNTFAAFGSNINNVPRNIQASAAAAQNLTQTAARTSAAVATTASEFEEFGRQSALAVRRFAAFATVTGIIFKVNNAIASASQEFLDFNKELVRVSQVTDSSLSSLGGLVSTITNLSTSFGVASKDLITVSSTLAQAGLNAKDTETALKALALSALAPSFDSLNDTVEGSIALMRQFGLGAKDLESALGSINAVAAKFAVESSDIITAIQRTGGVFAAASKGVSEGKDALNEFVAVFTSVRATTRESAETIATGLRTIFTRIQRADTVDALKAYGVSLTDLTGKFVGPYEAVKRLSEGLNQLDPRDLRFSRIVEELGGFRQIGKVIPLIQQFKTSQEALKVAQQGQSSLATDAATAQQSLANKISKVREEFVALIRSIGQNENFQSFVRLSLDLTSGLIRLADSAKSVLPALTAIAAIRGTSFLAQYATGFAGGIRSSRSQSPARGAANGGFMGFATGGLVPGVGDADTVKAKLTPGEFVMRKSAVRSIGASNLSRMNTGGELVQRFMAGSNTASGVARRRAIENKKPVDGMYSISTEGQNQQSAKDTYKSMGLGKYIRGGIRKVYDERNSGSSIEKSHIGGDIVLTKKQIQNYASRYKSAQFRRTVEEAGSRAPSLGYRSFSYGDVEQGNFDRKAFLKLTELRAKERVMLRLPETFNQALRSGDRNLVSVNGLIEYIKSQKDLFTGKYRNTNNAFLKTPLIDAIKKLPTAKTYNDSDQADTLAIDHDYQLNSLKSIITNGKQIDNLDFFFKPSATPYINKYGDISQDSIYIDKTTGKPRQRYQGRSTAKRSKLKYDGGIIQKFMAGSPGGVQEAELTPGELALQKASTTEIIRVLGAQKAAKAAGVSVAEVNQIIRSKDPAKQALRDAIDKEYIKAINRKAGGAKRQENRLSTQGLVVAGAGMFGSTFDKTEEIVSPLLSSSPKVRMIGGILSPKLAAKFDKQFGKASTRIANKASKKAMIYDVMDQFGMGRELNLDFDRTLAFGADKILSDPRTPAFAEFSNPTKVVAALQKAKLSSLGKELVKLVSAKPDLLPAMKVVTARPQSTLGLVQQWLSQQGLPIPLSQFKGFGGPNVSAANIANLKAAFLNPNSLFVDDDPRNIAAADARGDVRTYQYGAKLSKPNTNTDTSIQGGILEKVIENLGGPGSVKGLGFDFPNGLKGAAKYFNLSPDIPTDVKRTLSGPSTIKDNIVTYLRNVMGYMLGGKVRSFKLGGAAYALQKGSGLSDSEFNSIKQFADINDYTLQEFKIYLQKRIQEKKNKAGSITNPASLLRAITPEASQASQKQNDLARSLMGTPDAKYNPKYDATRFAGGGLVPAMVSNGEGYVPPDMAKSIGYSQLNKLNQADRNGLASFAGGGVSLFKGPGHGTSDSIGPIGLPVGSFILREKAVKALGLNRGGAVGVRKFSEGGFNDPALDNEARRIAINLIKSAGLSAKDALDQARDSVRASIQGPTVPIMRPTQATLTTPSGSRLTPEQITNSMTGPVSISHIQQERLERRAASRGTPINTSFEFEEDSQGRRKLKKQRRTDTGANISAISGFKGSIAGVDAMADTARNNVNIRNSSSDIFRVSTQRLDQIFKSISKDAQQSSAFFDRIKNAASTTATKATGLFSRVTGRGMSPEDRERIQKRNQQWANTGMALAFTGPMIADQIGSMIGGSKGAAIGGGGAAIGSAVAVGAQFGPWGALAGVVAGAAMAFEGANKAVAEFENTLSDNKIKTATDDLDKNLQLMAKDPKNMAARQAAAASFKILSEEEDAKAKRNEEIRKPSMITSGLSSADQYLRTSTIGNFGIGGFNYASISGYLGGPDQTPRQLREQRDLQLRNDQQTGFQQAQARLNAAMNMTSGKGFSAAMGTMSPEEQKAIKKNIAQGQAGFNVSYQVMEKQKTQTTDPQLIARIEKEQEALIERYFQQGTQLERAAAADAQRASSVAKLTQSINTATTSIARTFENMNQAVNKSMFNIESASEKIESIASGRASLKSSFGKMSENVLRNPNVYSAQDRTQAVRQVSGFFGQDEKFVQRLVDFGDTVKDTISSITATSQSSNLSPEAMVDSIDREISNKLLSQFGNNSLTTQIRQQIRASLEQQSKSEDGIDVQKILDSSGINNLIDANKQALESMINQFNMVRSALDLFGNAVGKAAEIQTQIIDKIAAGTEALASVDVRKKDLFGQDVSLAERSRGRSQAFEIRAGVKAGGATAANLLSQRTMQQNTRDSIERQRDSIEKSGNAANPALIAQTQKLTKSLAEWDQKLQRSENAIENLPSLIQGNIDDIFNELQKELSKRENKNQAGAAFAEKLVTSTPQELNSLNSTFALLNNTLSGNITTFNNSAVAQKAYQEAINNGSTQVEAMTAAQSAFASENKNMFSLFNELISVSGMKPEEANSLRADLIRNTAKAQGLNVDNNPMINQILSSLEKPPQEDPKIVALTRALEEQKAALVNAYEAAANVLGDKMTKLINAAGEAVANAIRSTPLNFGNAQNNNASMGIMRPGNVLGRSSGGVVYASTGTLVPYQPRGTDTVPAMLTPGEFVINRSATQQHLPLLKAINSGNYAKGGVVYLEEGGFGSRLGRNVLGSPVGSRTARRVWEKLIQQYGPDSDIVLRFQRDYGIDDDPYRYYRSKPSTPNVRIDSDLEVKSDILLPNRPRRSTPNFRFGNFGNFLEGLDEGFGYNAWSLNAYGDWHRDDDLFQRRGSPLARAVTNSLDTGTTGFMNRFRDTIEGFTSATSLSPLANEADWKMGSLYRAGDLGARGFRGVFRGGRNLLSAGLRISPGLASSTLLNTVLARFGLDSNIVDAIGAGVDLGGSGALAARAGGTFMGGAGAAAPGLLAANTALSFLSETGQLVFDNQNYRRGLNQEDQSESAGRTGLFERGYRSTFGSTGSSVARFADNTAGWIGGGISGGLNPFRTFYKAGSVIGQTYNERYGSAEEKAARSNDIMGASRMTQQEYNNAKMDRQMEMSRYETTRTDGSGQTTNIPEHLRGLNVIERNYVSRMATLEKAIEEAKDDYAGRNNYASFPGGRWDAMTPQEKMQADSTLYNLEQEYNTTQRKETTQIGYLYDSKVKDTRYKASDATLDQAIEKERTYRASEAKKEKDRAANKQAAADKAKKDSRAAQEQKQIEESNRKKERDKQDRQFTSIASGPNYFGDVAGNDIYQSQVQDREKAARTKTGYVKDSQQASGYLKRPPIPDVISENQKLAKERQDIDRQIYDLDSELSSNLDTNNPFRDTTDPKILKERHLAERKRLEEQRNKADRRIIALNTDPKIAGLSLAERDSKWKAYENNNRKVQKDIEKQKNRELVREQKRQIEQEASLYTAISRAVGGGSLEQIVARSSISDNPRGFVSWKQRTIQKLQKKFYLSGRTSDDIAMLSRYGMPPKVAQQLLQPLSDNQSKAIIEVMRGQQRGGLAKYSARDIALLSMSEDKIVELRAMADSRVNNSATRDARLTENQRQRLEKAKEELFVKTLTGFSALEKAAANAGGNLGRRNMISKNLYKKLTKEGYIDPNDTPEANTARLQNLGLNNSARLLYPANGRFMPANNASRGGVIYASNGTLVNFEPKGTDTVPAMLTPGEFVVNAKATSEHLPLLKAINNSKGGQVSYLAAGGLSGSTQGSSNIRNEQQKMFDARILQSRIENISNTTKNTDKLTTSINTNQLPSLATRTQNIGNTSDKLSDKSNKIMTGITKISTDMTTDTGSILDSLGYKPDFNGPTMNHIKNGIDNLTANGGPFDRLGDRVNNRTETIGRRIIAAILNPVNAAIRIRMAGPNQLQELDDAEAEIPLLFQNKGGMVYASNGTLIPYQPRGTDTVPAMLTPGEFVVNARSTAQNLPLLQAINRQTGGEIPYSMEEEISKDMELPGISKKNRAPDAMGLDRPAIAQKALSDPMNEKPVRQDLNNRRYIYGQNKIDIANANERRAVYNELFNRLIPYTSSDIGIQKLQAHFEGKRGNLSSTTMTYARAVGLPPGSNPNTFIGRSGQELRAETDLRDNSIIFAQPFPDTEAVRHELGHALQNSIGRGREKSSRLIESAKVFVNKFSNDPKYQQYKHSKHKLFSSSEEIFPSLLEFMDAPEFNAWGGPQALKDIMKSYGFSKGGVVYAQNGGNIPSSKKDQARLRAIKAIPPQQRTIEQNQVISDHIRMKEQQGTRSMNDMRAEYKRLDNIEYRDAQEEQQRQYLRKALSNDGFRKNSTQDRINRRQKILKKPEPVVPGVPSLYKGGIVYAQQGGGIDKRRALAMEAKQIDTDYRNAIDNNDWDMIHQMGVQQETFNYNPLQKGLYNIHEGLQERIGGNKIKKHIRGDRLNRNDSDTISGKIENLYSNLSWGMDGDSSGVKGFQSSLMDYEDYYDPAIFDQAIMRGRALSRGGVVYAENGGSVKKPDLAAQAIGQDQAKEKARYKAYGLFLRRFGKYRPEDPQSARDVVEILRKNSNEQELNRAAKKYKAIQDAKNQIDRENKASFGVNGFNNGGIVYASNGTLVNYEPRGTDTVPAMLTPGEFVVNRSATQQHLPLLRAINSNNYQYGDIVKPGGSWIDARKAQKTNKRYQGIMQERRDAYESMMSERRSTYENTMSERRSDYVNRSNYTPAKQAPQQTSMAFNFTPVFNGLNQFVGVLNTATKTLAAFGQQNPGNSGNSVSNNSNTSLDGLSQFTAQFNDFIGQLQKLNLPEVISVQGNHKVEVVINGGQALQNLLEGPIGSLVQNQVKSAFDRLSNNTEGSIRNPYA